MMDQSVIDRAVAIATKCALNGYPAERIVWMPPATTASDPSGSFIIMYRTTTSASAEIT